MMVPVASAPPAHMVISAVLPSRRSSSCRAVVIRREPVLPTGWPSAIAPPLTLTLSRSGSCTAAQDSATEAKASLTSNRSMSPMRHAGRSEHPLGGLHRAVEVEVGLGADEGLGDDPGARPAGRARAARSASISSTAAAPSEICEEVPAVWMPPSRTRLELGERPRSVVSRRPWSR